MTRIILLVLISCLTVSCRQSKNLVGSYHGNFAMGAGFRDHLQLFDDSTFAYEYTGHMEHLTGAGKYHLASSKLFLDYVPLSLPDTVEIDSIPNISKKSIIAFTMSTWRQDSLLNSTRPRQFEIKSKGLFILTENGQIKKRPDRVGHFKSYYLKKEKRTSIVK